MMQQSVKMAWKSISSNKMRSFLTMLGIIIGVLALVVLVSLVSGATSSVNDQISSMGANLIQVSVMDDKDKPVKLSDLEDLAEEEEIRETAPVAQINSTASTTYAEETAVVYGTTGVYSDIMQQELYSGRFLKNTDVDNHTNVAVINAGLATEVLGRMDVVGETIKLDGVSYMVVGVLQADDSDTSTTQTYEAYIPYTSLVRLTDSVSMEITSFYVSAVSEESLDPAEEVVTERTREIGIRKAIGAGRGVIMLQFLIEALMISLMGCAIGILLSWITLQVISVIGKDSMTFALSPGVVWIAVAFSILIGVVFGIYPANKAAKKKPIDALRYNG